MKKGSKNELKVGIITIIFIIVLYIALKHMGVVGKKEGKTFVVQFSRIGGITEGASVRYAGMEIGKVKEIDIKPAPLYTWNDKKHKFELQYGEDGRPKKVDQALITIMITRKGIFKNDLPEFTDKTEIMISQSLMGEKWIEIRPQTGTPIRPGQIILGHPPTTVEDFIAKAEDAIEKLETAVDSFNNVLGDPQIQRDIKLSLENFKDLTANLKDASSSAKEGIERISNRLDTVTMNVNRVINNVDGLVSNVDRQVSVSGRNLESLTGTLKRMAITNESDIRLLVKNLVTTSKSLKNTLKVVEELVSRKEFSEDILATLHNIKAASEEVMGIASDIRAVTSDGQIREDLKTAVHEAQEAATGANQLIKGVNGFLGIKSKDGSSVKMKKLVELNAEAEWNEKNGRVSPNVNAVLLPQHRGSVKFGVDSIGYDNLWNLQYRMGTGVFKPRIGLVRSKFGIGTDLDLGKSLDVFVDAYNPRDVNVDVTGRILLMKDFYLLGGVRDVFDKKNTVFGAGKRF